MRIGGVEIASKLYLAPMAGVTDAAFRQICREHGAGLSCTELVSAKALCYDDEKSKKLLFLAPNEKPGVVQIFGSVPEEMARAAKVAVAVSGADILDINMGCPVHKVAAHGSGAALMREPEKAAAIAAAVVDAVDVPVTVKLRLGWDKGSLNAAELAVLLERAGVAAVTVHGRTRAQMYGGQADWTAIRRVREALPQLLADYRSLQDTLGTYFGPLQSEAQADDNLPEIDAEELQELYEAIAEFAGMYDADAISRLLQQTESSHSPITITV